ncbi:MAG: SDR family NAD(P)-dependent oxidoreductase [Oscillospiraceae bacterium]|nr:SDR family NAD(P)-dependent oxidoreductase [Oscillospiraceae bacterium]
MNIAIITGASSGLGIEFLREISASRTDIDEIWLIARRLDRLNEIASEFSNIKCVPLSLDLSSEESYAALDDKLNSDNYNVKLLVNNAGFGKMGNIKDIPYPSQTSMVDLNCKGLTAVAAICLKHMSRGSEIINVCSIASFVPNPRLTVYSSTKAYVLSFTKGLREELKPYGINCMCVCPGPMKTEFFAVADIAPGSSKAFDTLPYSDPAKVARGTLKASKKGRCVYTHLMFFKFYRVLAKLLPHNLLMKISKV